MAPDDKTYPRAHPRYPVRWQATLKCSSWDTAVKVVTANASRGGVFLRTEQVCDEGAPVEVTIALPDGQCLSLAATVVHVRDSATASAEGKSPGVGVRFDPEHELDLMVLESMARAEMESPPSGFPEGTPAPVEVPAASGPGTEPSTLSVPLAKVVRRGRRPLGDVAPILGIDFGTSYSSVSVAIGETVFLIPDEHGRTAFPSVVSYPKKGTPRCGFEARERLVLDPARTIPSAKRLLGCSYDDPYLAGLLHQVAFRTHRGPDGGILVELDGEELALPQVCGEMMRFLRDLAVRQVERDFERAVLTVPVGFSDGQVAALRRAAELAGLEVVDTVREPVAGALAYGYGRQRNELVAVYDFGGGTFDFSVVDVSGDSLRVLATAGDAWLGGDDFDLALAQHVADAFWREHKIDLRKRQVEWQRLLLASEEAKRQLSEADFAFVTVDRVVEAPRRLNLRHRLDRSTLEDLCQDLFRFSTAICKKALQTVGLEPSDVTQLVAAGGVSRIPFVRRGLAALFEGDIDDRVAPDQAVALGAGVRAAECADHPVVRVADSGTW